MYAVILAGGGGTRLWPLSRPERPKPFLPLTGDRTLLELTVDRLDPLIDPADVFVVTDRRYGDLVRRQLPTVTVIEEPVGRNTAPAIALAALAIDRPADDVMIVLPADHTIVNEVQFQATLGDGADWLAVEAFGIEGPLVTLGVEVDRAATEYGYLIPNIDRGEIIGGIEAYPLRAFEEKPSRVRAEQLRHQPGVAWNAGMFLWKRGSILGALDAHQPDLMRTLRPAVSAAAGFSAPVAYSALAAAYETIPGISIDYAVMEPAAAHGTVVMGSMAVGWSDLGGWTALLRAIGARGTGRVVPAGEAVGLNPDDLLIERHGAELIVLGGPRGTIRDEAPRALLSGAASDRDRIEALLERVATRESARP